jgi:two-component sensor histidine kinase
MGEIWNWLFGTARFIPHGVCLLWRPDLVALHVVSDAIVALAYFAIPLAIFVYARRRFDLEPEQKRVAVLFIAFIIACGLTHVASIVILWRPLYGVQGLLKGATAAVSLMTAAYLLARGKRLMQLPSARALKIANDSLAAEVAAHQATLKELRAAQAELSGQLADRDEDLRIANHRFASALENSSITVFEQDADLRYTWIYNPPPGFDAGEMIGKDEYSAMSAKSADQLRALKREALEAGEVRRLEIEIVNDARAAWFDLQVQPMILRDGRQGVIASAMDITHQKRAQADLQLVMHELNHRSKNLLTIVQAIARQSAGGIELPRAYLARFSDRLRALANAHDVLIQRNWLGADLRSVIESQLRPHIEAGEGRLRLSGEPYELAPGAAHYVGLAIHELGANAAKYGALSNHTGVVEVSWRIEPDADGRPELRLEWRERGGPIPHENERRGFGRTILEVLAPRALQGSANLSFADGGLTWELRAPLDADSLS